MARSRKATDHQEATSAAHIEARRARVAELAATRMSERAITARLEVDGFINVETGRPFGKTAIHEDLLVIRADWRKAARRSTDTWVAEELAGLNHIEQCAYAENRYDLVLRVKDQRAKLLGLNAPTRTEMTGADGASIKLAHTIDLTGVDDEQLTKLVEHLKD